MNQRHTVDTLLIESVGLQIRRIAQLILIDSVAAHGDRC